MSKDMNDWGEKMSTREMTARNTGRRDRKSDKHKYGPEFYERLSHKDNYYVKEYIAKARDQEDTQETNNK